MGDGVSEAPILPIYNGKSAYLRKRKAFRRLGGKSPSGEINFGGEGRDRLQKQYDIVGTGFEPSSARQEHACSKRLDHF
jgi:hypothetical protein